MTAVALCGVLGLPMAAAQSVSSAAPDQASQGQAAPDRASQVQAAPDHASQGRAPVDQADQGVDLTKCASGRRPAAAPVRPDERAAPIASGAQTAATLFTQDELAWMARKGVVRYTIDPAWAPLEYVEAGKPHGLMVHYLDALSRFVPIRFEFVPTTSWHDAVRKFSLGEIDLLPGSTLCDKDRALLGSLQQIVPYYVGSTMVAARLDHPVVLEVSNLAGLRVAVADEDDSVDFLRQRVPDITLTSYPTPQAMLEAVLSREVDVAVAPELVLLPLMSRSYRGQIGSAGTLVDLPVVQRMGVRGDADMLKSILDRALMHLTAGETDDILDAWQATIDFGQPRLSIMWRHYKTEIALVIVLVLFLISAAMFAFYLRRQAQRSAQRKMRFLTTVSHEIRNAMNAVVGPLDVLAHEPVAAKRLEMIDTARDGARVLMETVNSLLDLSTLRARKSRVQAQPAQIGQIADDVLRLMRPGVPESIALLADVKLDRWVVLDAPKYRQVLMNLLSNAIKFTEQGQIGISVEIVRKSRTMWLLTRVSDSGSGIAPERLRAIFDAYTQGHDETTLMQANIASTRRGSGLGLTICSELVGLQGGRMWAESTPGAGSDFYFELPVELGEVLPVRSEAPAVAPQALDQPVLVIDDNPVNLMVLRKQLDVLDCPVTTCVSSREALDVWRQGLFGLILLDCNMPDIDGYELARLIRAQEAHSGLERTAIVAVSARNDAMHRQRCYASGMDDVMVKPLQVDQLRQMLAQWMRRAPPASQPPAVPTDQAIAEMFVQTNAEDLAIIRRMQAERRAADIAHRAHRVSGAASVMQEEALAQVARSLEALGHAVAPEWDQIAVACDRLADEMAAYAQRNALG